MPEMEPEATLPDGFRYVEEKGVTECGELDVEHAGDPRELSQFVRLLGADGKARYEAHGIVYRSKAPKGLTEEERREWEADSSPSNLTAHYCGDLTLDGVPELVLAERTLGAHCCVRYEIVSLTSPPTRVLSWVTGDAGELPMPVRYLAEGAWQLESEWMFWPPFDTSKGDPALSHASGPMVPVIFSWVGGSARGASYRLTSLSFPEAYRKHRERSIADFAKYHPGEYSMAAWLDSLVVGDWDVEKRSSLYDQDRAALDRRARATLKKLGAEAGSLKAPVPVKGPFVTWQDVQKPVPPDKRQLKQE